MAIVFHGGLGETPWVCTDKAFEALDEMVDKYGGAPVHFISEPLLKNITGDPRWNEFWEKLGKSPDQVANFEFNPKLP